MTSHQSSSWIDDAMADATERAQRKIALQELVNLGEEMGVYDAIKPSHYNVGGIETIDYIRAKLGKAGYEGYCLGNILKYVSRADHKDGVQDLKKAAKYLEWLIESKSV
jgi:hypothetical protein